VTGLQHATMAMYNDEMRATTDLDHLETVRDLLETKLEQANYPVREVEVIERDASSVELVATLVANTADPVELEIDFAATFSPFRSTRLNH
jgi:hypothetical protein